MLVEAVRVLTQAARLTRPVKEPAAPDQAFDLVYEALGSTLGRDGVKLSRDVQEVRKLVDLVGGSFREPGEGTPGYVPGLPSASSRDALRLVWWAERGFPHGAGRGSMLERAFSAFLAVAGWPCTPVLLVGVGGPAPSGPGTT